MTLVVPPKLQISLSWALAPAQFCGLQTHFSASSSVVRQTADNEYQGFSLCNTSTKIRSFPGRFMMRSALPLLLSVVLFGTLTASAQHFNGERAYEYAKDFAGIGPRWVTRDTPKPKHICTRTSSATLWKKTPSWPIPPLAP
jgi:hypothetical protein